MIYVACFGADFMREYLSGGKNHFRVQFSSLLCVMFDLSPRLRRKCRNGRRQRSFCCWRRLKKRGQALQLRTSILNHCPCQYLSSCSVFPGNPADHWPSQGAQVQPVNLKTLYNNNPFAVHTDRVNSYSPNRLMVITDLSSGETPTCNLEFAQRELERS